MSDFWKFSNKKDIRTIIKALINPLLIKDDNLRLFIWKECLRVGWERLINKDLVACVEKLKHIYKNIKVR